MSIYRPVNGYKFQVNFDVTYVEGKLNGHRYNGQHLSFVCRADALHFMATCDGKSIVHECNGLGKYVKSDAVLIDLRKFLAA